MYLREEKIRPETTLNGPEIYTVDGELSRRGSEVTRLVDFGKWLNESVHQTFPAAILAGLKICALKFGATDSPFSFPNPNARFLRFRRRNTVLEATWRDFAFAKKGCAAENGGKQQSKKRSD